MELQVVVTSRVGDDVDVDADADADVDSLQKQIKVVSRRIYSGLQNHNLVQLGPSSMWKYGRLMYDRLFLQHLKLKFVLLVSFTS